MRGKCRILTVGEVLAGASSPLSSHTTSLTHNLVHTASLRPLRHNSSTGLISQNSPHAQLISYNSSLTQRNTPLHLTLIFCQTQLNSHTQLISHYSSDKISLQSNSHNSSLTTLPLRLRGVQHFDSLGSVGSPLLLRGSGAFSVLGTTFA